MAATTPNRRLAAVLFADVAGYSRLMEQDESGTHVRVGAVFAELIEPSIASHAGRLIARTGDGILVEFSSATAALRCAVEVQRQAEERNLPYRPRDQIRFRIGINVADILADENDIAGGGVNLAARMETLAPPGGICVSHALKEQIQEDLGVEFVDCGMQHVKNIRRPVRVFEVLSTQPRAFARWRIRVRQTAIFPRWGWVAVSALALAAGLPFSSRWSQSADEQILERLTLAVLPFGTDSPDPATTEIASGLQRRLLMALSPESNLLKVKGLVAEGTTDERWDLKRVRSDLKARYAMVGEVVDTGWAHRVEARLVDASTGTVAWGDRFEIPKNLEYAAFDIITKRLAPAVVGAVFELEMMRINKAPPANPDPMDLVFLGYGELASGTPDSLHRADERFRQALASDGKFVPALLARVMVLEARRAESSDDTLAATLLREANQLALAAVTTDPQCAASWAMRSSVLAAMGHQGAALAAAEKAVRINPTNTIAQLQYQSVLIGAGRSNEVIQPIEQVTLIHEKFLLSDFARLQCMARLYAGRMDDAPSICEIWYALGGGAASLQALAAVYANRGETEKAGTIVVELLRAKPNTSIGEIRKAHRPAESANPALMAQAENTLYAGLKRANLRD